MDDEWGRRNLPTESAGIYLNDYFIEVQIARAGSLKTVSPVKLAFPRTKRWTEFVRQLSSPWSEYYFHSTVLYLSAQSCIRCYSRDLLRLAITSRLKSFVSQGTGNESWFCGHTVLKPGMCLKLWRHKCFWNPHIEDEIWTSQLKTLVIYDSWEEHELKQAAHDFCMLRISWSTLQDQSHRMFIWQSQQRFI